MDQIIFQRIVGAIVRHGLTAAAGALVAQGVINSTDTTEIVAGLTTGIVALAWSLYNKRWRPRTW